MSILRKPRRKAEADDRSHATKESVSGLSRRGPARIDYIDDNGKVRTEMRPLSDRTRR